MRSSRNVQWMNIPMDLVAYIGKRLDTHSDVLRLRAVCKSWRVSVPASSKNYPSFPIKLPCPTGHSGSCCILTESTVYCVEPLKQDSSSSLSSCSKAWLMKVQESKMGKVRLLNLLTNKKIEYPPETFPKVFNLLDFQVSELCKVYTLEYVSGSYPDNHVGVEKAIFRIDDCAVLVIHGGGNLSLLKLGEEKWTQLGEQRWYTDIMLYKGEIFVTDRVGKISVIDSSLKLTEYSSTTHGWRGCRKHLVESCGDFYMLDRWTTLDMRGLGVGVELPETLPVIVNFFAAYKQDGVNHWTENEKHYNWAPQVKTLGDRVFFVGDDCSFSVSAQDFYGELHSF